MIDEREFTLCTEGQPPYDDLYMVICTLGSIFDPKYYFAIRERFIDRWCVEKEEEEVVAWAMIDDPKSVMQFLKKNEVPTNRVANTTGPEGNDQRDDN